MSWCDACQNTGELDCHCGGDLCVCENNGTYRCPRCGVEGVDDAALEPEAERRLRAWTAEQREKKRKGRP